METATLVQIFAPTTTYLYFTDNSIATEAQLLADKQHGNTELQFLFDSNPDEFCDIDTVELETTLENFMEYYEDDSEYTCLNTRDAAKKALKAQPRATKLKKDPRKHGSFNHTEYSFTHHTGVIVRGTAHDLYSNYTISEASVSNIIRGKSNMVEGWRLSHTPIEACMRGLVGFINPIYELSNESGDSITGTKKEILMQLNLKKGNFSRFINGKIKSWKGFTTATCALPTEPKI